MLVIGTEINAILDMWAVYKRWWDTYKEEEYPRDIKEFINKIFKEHPEYLKHYRNFKP